MLRVAVVKLLRKLCRKASGMPCYPHAILSLQRDPTMSKMVRKYVKSGGADVVTIPCLKHT
jgi:hypothetical protein